MTGKLYIVGVGPGHHNHMTFRAKEVISESDTIVGYETYVNLVQDLIVGKTIHRYAMTQEVERSFINVLILQNLEKLFLWYLVEILEFMEWLD